MPWQFLPPELDLEEASIALGLPGRTKLRRSGIATLATGGVAETEMTALKLTLGAEFFQVDFTPGLVIELPAPLVNLGLGGVTYDLRSGDTSPRVWHESEIGIPLGKGAVLDDARAFLRELVTSTPLAIPPYDPRADTELVLAVKQILANLAGDGGASIVRDVSVSARLVVHKEIVSDAGAGGFRIPAGAKIALKVDLAGTPAELEASLKIRQVEVECTSLVLRSEGEDQAELGRVILTPGCSIEVTKARPLGAPAKAAAMESLVRLFGALSTQGAAGLAPENLEACVVEGLVKKEIEGALQAALLQWVNENATIASGIDLRSVLGVPVQGGEAKEVVS